MSTFKLPDLGEGLAEAQIHKWHVAIGDHVEVDDLLLTVETAKAIVDIPSPQRGIIKNLHVKEGNSVAIGSPLVEFDDNSLNDHATVAGKIDSGEAILEEAAVITTNYHYQDIIKASPAVRALAKKLDIDLTTITPSGPHGSIAMKDLEDHTQNSQKKLNHIRKAMNFLMLESKNTVVPATICDDANISSWGNEDVTLRLIRALLTAIKKEPSLNAWFNGDDLTLKICGQVNLGLAIDSSDGLFMPVLKGLTLDDNPTTLRSRINTIKAQIQDRTISPQDLQHATIVLSNVGIYGTKYSTPVVVPPTVAIIASGKIYHNPSRTIPLSLTFNHRVITGGEAARFLQAMIDDLSATK